MKYNIMASLRNINHAGGKTNIMVTPKREMRNGYTELSMFGQLNNLFKNI